MSFFESLLGNAAIAGEGIIGRQIKQDDAIEQENNRSANSLSNSKSLAVYNDELQAARAATTNALKRTQSQADGQAISDGADRAYQQRVADDIGGKSGTPLTEEQAKTIMASPEALKANGIVERNRAGVMDDQIATAQKLGLNDHVKELRGQQDVELRRDRENRLEDEGTRRFNIKEKFDQNRANYQDRIAAVAEARLGRMEKNQSTQMERAELNSTRQSLTSVLKDIAGEESRIDLALASGMATPEQMKEYGRQREILARDRVGAKNQLLSLSGVDMKVGQAERPQQSDATADATAAVATGRISLVDANKRLVAAGHKPLATPEDSKKPQGSSTSSAKPASGGADATKQKIEDLLARSERPGVDPLRALEFRREAEALQKGSRPASVLGGYQK
jgi:hypothetical protein